MRPRSLYAILAFFLMLMTSPSFADAYELSYGGRLTSDVGAPVEGPVDLLVSFYNVSVGGSALKAPLSFDAVEIDEGLFQIDLNLSITDINLIFPVSSTSPAYVEITATKNGVSTTYPRQKFSAVPYALRVPVDGTSVGYNANGKLSIVNVDKLQGRAVSTGAPTANDVLSWDGEKWLPVSAGTFGGGTVTSVATGAGLIGGPITGIGTVHLNLNTSGGLSKTLGGSSNELGIAAGGISGGIGGVIADSTITNDDISATASIATAKLSGAVTDIATHGLGTMATQAANSVSITGGSISGLTTLSSNGYIKPGTGTAADCDGSKEGMIRYNSTTKRGEICNGTAWASMDASAGSIPTGTIAFFSLASCPTGWTEKTALRGRYPVGLPSGGTLGLTNGTALSDGEDRAVGRHNHLVTDPGHSHGVPTGVGAGGYQTHVNGTPNIGSIASDSSTSGISIQNAGSVAGTNAPYIQYLACEKQ